MNITVSNKMNFFQPSIPHGWTSMGFSYALIEQANVVVTPGDTFGPNGEGYVRMALVQDIEVLKKAISNIKEADILNYKMKQVIVS